MKKTNNKKAVNDTILQFNRLCLEHDIEALKVFTITPEYDKYIRLAELNNIHRMVTDDHWKKPYNTKEGSRIPSYELPIIIYIESITSEYYKKIDEALEDNNMPFLKDKFPELVDRQTERSKNDIYHFEQFLNKSLVKASKNGYVEMVQYLTTSPDLEIHAQVDHNKNECLIEACNAGHIDIIRFLISSSKLEKPIQVYQNYLSRQGCAESKEYLSYYTQNLTFEYNQLSQFKTKFKNTDSNSFINEIVEYLDKPVFKEFETLYQKFVDDLFLAACRSGKADLVDFFLKDKKLTFHATGKFREGFKEACNNNQAHLIAVFEKYPEFIKDKTYFTNIGVEAAIQSGSLEVVKTLASNAFMSKDFFYFSNTNFNTACKHGDIDTIKYFINTPEILKHIFNDYPYEKQIDSVMKGNYKEERKIEILDIIFNDKKLTPTNEHHLYDFQKDKAKNFDYVSLFIEAIDNQYNDMVEYFLNDKNLSKNIGLPKNAEAITLKVLNNKNHNLLNSFVCNYGWQKTDNIAEQIAINKDSTNIAVQEFAKYADNLFSMAQLNSKLYALTENKDLENNNMGKKKI